MEVVNTPESTGQEQTTRPGFGRVGWVIAFVVLAALLVLVYFGLQNAQRGRIAIGDTVSDFSLTTFDGQQINYSDLAGKVVVLNFWASWCKPCEQEAVDLETAWRFYQPGGEVVFLGVDYVDTEPDALGYLEKFEITYPNGPDLGTRISQQFGLRGVPETFFMDKNGKLADFQVGPFSSLAQIKAKIEPLLNE
jgi:cytochrome c biogenesis protein CcmG/thiol:disulfide interchange protein DsbE